MISYSQGNTSSAVKIRRHIVPVLCLSLDSNFVKGIAKQTNSENQKRIQGADET